MEVKPGNNMNTKVMCYRLCRLNNSKIRQASQKTGKVHYYIKKIDILLKKHRLLRHDPIRVIDFLARFVNEDSIQEMSEAQESITLFSFLEGVFFSLYEYGVSVPTRKDGAISSWYDIAQYFLRSYAQPNNITNAILQLRATRQSKKKIEQKYALRLNDGVELCSHVHESEDVITLFVEGMSLEVRSLIQGYGDNNGGESYLELVKQAWYEGKAIRTRNATGETTPTTPQVRRPAGSIK